MKQSNRIGLQLLLVPMMLLATEGAHAERRSRGPVEPNSSSVSIHVRAVRASQPRQEGESSEVSGKQIRLSQALMPLRHKLASLPFTSFEVLSEKSALVPVKKKHHLSFANGHSLLVRPLSVRDDGNICLWLRWKDKEGMKLLDSRIHVPRGESVLAGVEQSPSSGMVLAIDVSHRPDLEGASH